MSGSGCVSGRTRTFRTPKLSRSPARNPNPKLPGRTGSSSLIAKPPPPASVPIRPGFRLPENRPKSTFFKMARQDVQETAVRARIERRVIGKWVQFEWLRSE